MADMAWERAAGGSSGLSAAQVEHFFERGYVCCRQVLPPSKRRSCAKCSKSLPQSDFSKKQWGKAHSKTGTGRCKKCLGN